MDWNCLKYMFDEFLFKYCWTIIVATVQCTFNIVLVKNTIYTI